MALLSGSILAAHPIDTSRWTNHRVPISPSPSHLDASNDPSSQLHISFISCPPPSTFQSSKGTILLIHGFPQTSYQFRSVITPLSNAGYHVVAPDYRGAGESSKPAVSAEEGFSKEAMARDLRELIRKVVPEANGLHVVGHDIGGMVAHAYATMYPDETASVCWGECPIPGCAFYETRKRDQWFWHFSFHSIPDLPELLISSNISQYLRHFFTRHAHDSSFLTPSDQAVYTSAYSASGAVRCAMNVYRAFETDAETNRRWRAEKGKCKVRCLTLWGADSWMETDEAEKVAREFYESVEVGLVEGAGHWIAEERPLGFVEAVLEWVGRSK